MNKAIRDDGIPAELFQILESTGLQSWTRLCNWTELTEHTQKHEHRCLWRERMRIKIGPIWGLFQIKQNERGGADLPKLTVCHYLKSSIQLFTWGQERKHEANTKFSRSEDLTWGRGIPAHTLDPLNQTPEFNKRYYCSFPFYRWETEGKKWNNIPSS